MKYSNYKKNIGGFTVVEALVAIAILLLSITSAFSVAQSSLQSSNFAKNRTTAYFLAQEGIESIRHLRDNNGLKMLKENANPGSISWLGGFAEPGDRNSPCALDVNTCLIAVLAFMNAVNCNGVCPNFWHLGNEFFQYKGDEEEGAITSFNRSIQLYSVSDENGPNDNEIQVVVTVTWNQGAIEKSVVVSENLYNWQSLQSL